MKCLKYFQQHLIVFLHLYPDAVKPNQMQSLHLLFGRPLPGRTEKGHGGTMFGSRITGGRRNVPTMLPVLCLIQTTVFPNDLTVSSNMGVQNLFLSLDNI